MPCQQELRTLQTSTLAARSSYCTSDNLPIVEPDLPQVTTDAVADTLPSPQPMASCYRVLGSLGAPSCSGSGTAGSSRRPGARVGVCRRAARPLQLVVRSSDGWESWADAPNTPKVNGTAPVADTEAAAAPPELDWRAEVRGLSEALRSTEVGGMDGWLRAAMVVLCYYNLAGTSSHSAYRSKPGGSLVSQRPAAQHRLPPTHHSLLPPAPPTLSRDPPLAAATAPTGTLIRTTKRSAASL